MMAKFKIDVNDLHKYYGENEVLKRNLANSMKGMSFVSSDLQVPGKSTSLRSFKYSLRVTSGDHHCGRI